MNPRHMTEYRWGQRGELLLDHADIFWTNFRGDEKVAKTTGKVVNVKGVRNFNVYIYNTELAEELRDQGWNVKINMPNGENTEPLYFIPVEVRWRDKSGEFLSDSLLPKPYLEGSKGEELLNEATIGILDGADISDVGLTIRGRRYESMSGGMAVKAYMSEGWFVVEESNRGDSYKRKVENATAGGKFIFDDTIEDHVIEVLSDLESKVDTLSYEGGHDNEIENIVELIDNLQDVYKLHH